MEESKDLEIEKVLERNNATLVPMGGLVPIERYEVYDKERKIWKGHLVIPATSGAPDIIYFSRNYQPEINELDQIFVEIEFTDTEILGVPFLMVPKEKFLFGYFKGSDTIVIPKIKISDSRHHMQ